MEHQTNESELQEKLLQQNRIMQINQGVLFCYNEDAEKMPVGVINNFIFDDLKTLHFSSDFFPVTEEAWDVFAAELHCYRKGLPFSFVLHGIVSVRYHEPYLIRFTIMQTDYFELQATKTGNSFEPLSLLLKPYKFMYQKSSEIISHTFKRKDAIHPLNHVAGNS